LYVNEKISDAASTTFICSFRVALPGESEAMRGSGSSGLLMRRHHGDSGDGRGQRGTTAGKFGLVGGR